MHRRMISGLFELCQQRLVNERVPLSLYKSKRSALRVAVADVKGPMVKGLISFVTATDTDDGLPHTLEHLVFMGSHKYPYKGVLDVIANRCLASGTNAYTDTDHTAYSLNTVGSKGFLKVLPVYLSHLFEPLLTDSQYKTEVHHINGEGADAGVVYSEMQDGESEMDYIIHWRRKELVYPNYPEYRVETGGRLKNLRTTCNNDKVRAFHKKFYNLHNCFVIVSGQIDHSELLEVIGKFEEGVLDKTPSTFERPFQTPVPNITETKNETLVVPGDDPAQGSVQIAWLGPNASNVLEVNALETLFKYFTQSTAAPFQKDFILCENPYCSNVSIYMTEQAKCEIIASFSGVGVDRIQQIERLALEKTIADHTNPTKFDLTRMNYLIDQAIKRTLVKMETAPNSLINNALIGHQLFGNDSDSTTLGHRLNSIAVLKELKEKSGDFWSSLTSTYFLSPHVTVVGIPDPELAEKIAREEEERIENQRKRMGKDGLEKAAKSLEDAIRANTEHKPKDGELPIVDELEKFDTFDINILSNLRENATKKRRTFIDDLPFPALLHEAPTTKFIEMTLIVDTSLIPLELRHYMMLWHEAMFESPAIIDGKKHTFEEVSILATRDLISRTISTGISNFYDQYVSLKLKVDAQSYPQLSRWTKILLEDLVFDPERIAITAKKLATQASEMKRDAHHVASVLMANTISKSDANNRFYNVIALEKFHHVVSKAAECKGDEVVAKLNSLKEAFLQCPINVHYACNSNEINSDAVVSSEWNFIKKDLSGANIFASPPGFTLDWTSALGTQKLSSVASSESAFIIQKCPLDQSYDGPKLPSVLLLTQYLSQCEGPLWNQIRGRGLAYGANIYPLPDQGAMTLSLYRCSQPVEAYNATRDLVLDILEKKELGKTLFEAAKRSLVCELVSSYENVRSAAQMSLLSTVRSIGLDYIVKLCQKIWEATEDEVLANGSPYLRSLFDDAKTVRVATCHPSKLQELQKAFKNAEIVKLETIQVAAPDYNIAIEEDKEITTDEESNH